MKPKVPHPLRDPASNLCDIIKYGYFHQLRLLICSGVDLECRDSNRRTPIMLCAFMEPEAWGIGIARNLIENDVRVYRRDKFGRNVFHYACIYERVGLIQVLLKAMDFDLNQTDKLGNTALHYAALSGNILVTQIISRAFKRYKIHPGKTNRRGYTAREEALRTGSSKCGHAIEQEMAEKRPGSAVKDVRFADEVVEEQNMMKGHRSASNHHHQHHHHHHLSTHNNRPVYARPWSTPAILRPDSSLSSMSMEDRMSSNSFRSRSNASYGGSYRKPHKTLVAMGIRHDDDVIHCAEADDFRNKPDFVFKLVHLHYDANDWHPVLTQDFTSRKVAWNDTHSTSPTQAVMMTSLDWRQDLKSLFKVYESQCSASWRAAQRGKSLSQEEQDRIAAEMAEEDEKGKKPRRLSNNKTGGTGNSKEPVPELKRRMSTARMRRRSSIHGLALSKLTAGGAAASSSMDGSLNNSNESINSQVSTHKRRGSERELNPIPTSSSASSTALRSEIATTRSGLRRPSTDSRLSSSPSPTPQLAAPDTTNNKKLLSSKSSTSSKSQSLQQQQQQQQQLQQLHLKPSTTSENKENVNRAVAQNVAISGTHAQSGDSSKQQEACKSRGRRASLITTSQQSLGRKNDDTNVKINGEKSSSGGSNRNAHGAVPARVMSIGRVELKVNGGSSGSVTNKMAVPRVKESLVEDRALSMDVIQSKPDTTRLWVQNPYADDEYDDDEDDYDDNISEYDYESAVED